MAEWNKDALTAKLGDLKLYVIVKNGLIDKLQKAAGGFMSEAEAQAVESKPDNAEQMGELVQILRGKKTKISESFAQCYVRATMRHGLNSWS